MHHLRGLALLGCLTIATGCAASHPYVQGADVPNLTGHPSQQQALTTIERKEVAAARTRPASKRPEVTIPDVPKKRVLDALVGHMTRRDFTIRRVDEYRAQFEHPGGFWVDMLAGSRFNRDAPWRVSYTLFDAPDGVHVVADVGVVTNPGSALEHVTDIRNQKNFTAIQSILDSVRAEVSRTSPSAPTDSVSTSRKP